MAQLKDLLVFGPGRFMGDLIIQDSHLNDGHLILTPRNSSEGGQITLDAPLSNQTVNGILIDTANGLLRIFGKESRDGTTRASYGTLLTIDPYAKKISVPDTNTYYTTERIKVPYANITDPAQLSVVDPAGEDAIKKKASPFISDITVNDHAITFERKSIEQIGLSTVYRYKGTKSNMAGLYAINSAEIGDVYNITGADVYGNINSNWACYKKVTAATSAGTYATYWQPLGSAIVLAGYSLLWESNTFTATNTFSGAVTFNASNTFKAGNTFVGEQHMSSSNTEEYRDIASGIECSLKNTRAMDDQLIVGELLLPYNAAINNDINNGINVTASQMGIYAISGSASSKISGKQEVARFFRNAVTPNASYGTAYRHGLLICGPTYGNKADNKYGTQEYGKIKFGDPGPQIIFTTNSASLGSATGVQSAALIFTDHDDISAGSSLHLVSNTSGNPITLFSPYFNGYLHGCADQAQLLYPNIKTNTTIGVSGWRSNVEGTGTGQLGGHVVWGQKFINATATGNSDSGDILFWLKEDGSSATTLNLTIDGYYYQRQNQRLIDTTNVSGTSFYHPVFSGTAGTISNVITSGNLYENSTNFSSTKYWNYQHVSESTKKACYNQQSAINITGNGNTSGILGWISGKTYQGTIAISTDTDSGRKSNKLSIGYMLATGSGNSFNNELTWDGATGNIATTGTNIKFSSANFTYNTTDKCIDVTFN